ncbi:hypothetical protein WG66_000427 [Moniliophthora roreri]|nr:hypothetical protein WG66_000427 [Moniliophthora roreri]
MCKPQGHIPPPKRISVSETCTTCIGIPEITVLNRRGSRKKYGYSTGSFVSKLYVSLEIVLEIVLKALPDCPIKLHRT